MACLQVAVVLLLTSAFFTSTASGIFYTHAEAERLVEIEGISISSSGGCSDPNKKTCTSLEKIRSKCITGVIWLKEASGCTIVITGGTEIGHSGGSKSHGNGYKLDIRLNSCIDNYIVDNFVYAGTRSDGAKLYKDGNGNVYAKERSHWDILYP